MAAVDSIFSSLNLTIVLLPPCIRRPPLYNLSTTNLLLNVMEGGRFSVNISNKDSGGCPPSEFKFEARSYSKVVAVTTVPYNRLMIDRMTPVLPLPSFSFSFFLSSTTLPVTTSSCAPFPLSSWPSGMVPCPSPRAFQSQRC